MSIVHLSSVGQNPANFSNMFPQQINLPPNSEVRCLGYSGRKADITMAGGSDTAHAITIKKDLNDSFVVYHGLVADGTLPQAFQNVAFVCKVPPGTYGLNQPAPPAQSEFALVLERALNDCETAQEFYRPTTGASLAGWTVAYDPITTGSYTIELIQGRNRRQDAGMWDFYIDPKGTITPPASPGVLPTILSPDTTAGSEGGIFINLRQGFLGNNGLLLAIPNPSQGYEMTLEMGVGGANFADCAVTHGIVPISQLTVYKQISNTTEAWDDRKPNIERDPLAVPSSLSDWAYPERPYPFVTFGMTVNPLDGRVGVIGCAMFADNGALKQPDNQQVTWYDVVDNGAGSEVRLQMSPRFDPASGEYTLVFLLDNNTGTYVEIDSISFGSAGQTVNLMSAEHVYHTVYYDKNHISPTTIDVGMLTQNKQSVDSAALTNPLQPTTIVWQPLSDDLIALPQRLQQAVSQLSIENCTGLGAELGYDDYYLTSAVATATGWVSDTKHLAIPLTPIIITCPSLPIEGYIGSGGGGGASAPILAVCTLRNKTGNTGFSGLTQQDWVQLNNEYTLRIDQLNIKLVDQTNREYEGLMADFSCWLMFRCPTKSQKNYQSKAVGDANASFRDYY